MAFTAADLVLRTRELTQVFGSNLQMRDGFSADAAGADPAATRILPAINEYISILAGAGFYQKYFTVTQVNGTAQYAVDADCLEVLSLYHNGIALRMTTRDALDAYEPGWDAGAAGTPTRYIAEGNQITLVPEPNGSAAALVCRVWATATPPPLILTTDTITGMRNAQAIRIPYGAALILATIDDKNPAHVIRRDLYQKQADQLYAELAKIQQTPDDWTATGLDQYVTPPVIESGKDG